MVVVAAVQQVLEVRKYFGYCLHLVLHYHLVETLGCHNLAGHLDSGHQIHLLQRQYYLPDLGPIGSVVAADYYQSYRRRPYRHLNHHRLTSAFGQHGFQWYNGLDHFGPAIYEYAGCLQYTLGCLYANTEPQSHPDG